MSRPYRRLLPAPPKPSDPSNGNTTSHWHGLLSPLTPTLHNDTTGPYSAGSSDNLGGNATLTNPQDDFSGLQALQQSFHETSGDLGEAVNYGTPQSTQGRALELLQPSEQSDGGIYETRLTHDEFGEFQEHDTGLAHEHNASLNPASIRRSTRISTKAKATVPAKPAVVSARKAGNGGPVAPVSMANEASMVPFNANPISFEGLPIVQSLNWQLQYPPGGSTHPSYPYPTLDPRLVFHEWLVPLSGGLPDFAGMPKLVLPMGWIHVSWFGLLPIVFDPYRQAFKLTPVGPFPLTCEELHQNGLYKYVPGGELHPETLMLPQMMTVSDGSDGEVYDWEGVDWVLPWAGHEDFGAPSIPPVDPAFGIGNGPASQLTSLAPLAVVYPWKEARDCPNQVFDLEDGWRWLAGKLQHPDADFVPSPMKQWRGIVTFRSTRKLKSPLPELMILAKSLNPDNSNPVLQNQDTSREPGRYCIFCPFKSVATPVNLDITLLADTEFTVKELLCYFPQHFSWGAAAMRLARAGFVPSLITDMINMTRKLGGEVALKSANVGSATCNAKKRDAAKAEEMRQHGNMLTLPKTNEDDVTTSYTAEGWFYDIWSKIDYPLLALTHGLQGLPQGPDAGPLTSLIEWCRSNARYEVLISQVPALLQEAGITPLIEPGEHGCPDQEVLGRHAEALKEDKARVKGAGKKKRAMEGVTEKKGKKTKTD